MRLTQRARLRTQVEADRLDLQAMREWATKMHEEIYEFGQQCEHEDAVDVESIVDGAIVARLCPECDAQLPVTSEWLRQFKRVDGIIGA